SLPAITNWAFCGIHVGYMVLGTACGSIARPLILGLDFAGVEFLRTIMGSAAQCGTINTGVENQDRDNKGGSHENWFNLMLIVNELIAGAVALSLKLGFAITINRWHHDQRGSKLRSGVNCRNSKRPSHDTTTTIHRQTTIGLFVMWYAQAAYLALISFSAGTRRTLRVTGIAGMKYMRTCSLTGPSLNLAPSGTGIHIAEFS
ncbi:hypothetical protein FOZ63_033453, partial [Perkinsus olseni]